MYSIKVVPGRKEKIDKPNNGKLIISVYIPFFLVQLGLRLTVVFLPLYALELGAGILLSGIIVTAKSLGAMVFNLPAGFIIGRWRPKILMSISLCGIMAAALMRSLISTAALLLVGSFLLGMFTSFWDLTMLTYIRNNIPSTIRGRVLAGMGGLMRVSRMIGPLAGGLLISFWGYKQVFMIQGFIVFCAVIPVFFLLKPGVAVPSISREKSVHHLKTHMRKHRRNITAAIIGIIGISFLRVSRDFIIPLWADQIGISIALLGILSSVSALTELIFVYPAGWIMDKKGRKWTLFPAIVLMTLAYILLPLAGTYKSLLAVMLIMSIGNGLSSGINMTLGTDLAPAKAPGQFLGLWRFFSDGATAAGPVLIGIISSSFSLGVSSFPIAAIGFCSAAILLKFMDSMKHVDDVSLENS